MLAKNTISSLCLPFQHGQQCFCSDFYPSNIKADAHECNTPCSGGSVLGSGCGVEWHLSIWCDVLRCGQFCTNDLRQSCSKTYRYKYADVPTFDRLKSFLSSFPFRAHVLACKVRPGKHHQRCHYHTGVRCARASREAKLVAGDFIDLMHTDGQQFRIDENKLSVRKQALRLQ